MLSTSPKVRELAGFFYDYGRERCLSLIFVHAIYSATLHIDRQAFSQGEGELSLFTKENFNP